MPNYTKTSIYKICCKDATITDIYIGSTCNFNRRKAQHKSNCNKEISKEYNQYKYQFIRDNGGWDNWDMIELKEFSCENKREKDTEERKHIDELKPSLNKVLPTRTIKEWRKDNKQKKIQKDKDYYLKNKEKIKEQVKQYRLNNKEKFKEKEKEYRVKNKEKSKEYNKQYRLNNKEKKKQRDKEYYLKNKEKIKEKVKQYRLNNKEKYKD